jgi:hypothetical protein
MFAAMLIATILLSPLDGENLLSNASFEERTPDGRPRGWTSFVMPQPGAFADVDPLSFGGENSVMLHNPEPYDEEPANNWSQVIVGDLRGKELEFSGYARTEAATEASLWLQCFRQSPTQVVAAQTSALNDPLSGTSEWTRLSARVTAPASTDFVVVRCVIKGQGSAWFDELRLDAIQEPPAPLDVIEPSQASAVEEAPTNENADLDAADLLELSQALQRAVADLEASNAQILERVRALQEDVQRSRESADAIANEVKTYGAHPLVPHGYIPEEDPE